MYFFHEETRIIDMLKIFPSQGRLFVQKEKPPSHENISQLSGPYCPCQGCRRRDSNPHVVSNKRF